MMIDTKRVEQIAVPSSLAHSDNECRNRQPNRHGNRRNGPRIRSRALGALSDDLGASTGSCRGGPAPRRWNTGCLKVRRFAQRSRYRPRESPPGNNRGVTALPRCARNSRLPQWILVARRSTPPSTDSPLCGSRRVLPGALDRDGMDRWRPGCCGLECRGFGSAPSSPATATASTPRVGLQ